MLSRKFRLASLPLTLCLSGLLLSTGCATTVKRVPVSPKQLTAELSAETRTPCSNLPRPPLQAGLFDAARKALDENNIPVAKTIVNSIEIQWRAVLAFSVAQENQINCTETKRAAAVAAHDILAAEGVKLRGRLRD